MTPTAPENVKLKNLILGIDPGLSGALAFYDTEKRTLHSVHDMPKTTAKQIDIPAISFVIEALSPFISFAVIEQVASMPKQGVASTFLFGFCTGVVHGVVNAHGIAAYLVRPAIWKNLMHLSRDKNDSLVLARKKFPNHLEKFAREKDDGRAEAALLAVFGADRLYQQQKTGERSV